MKTLIIILSAVIGLNFFFTTKIITGSIVDEKGNPIENVKILAKGTSKYAISNEKGKYKIKITDDVKTLVFSRKGYKAIEKNISSNKIDVVLTLDEIKIVNDADADEISDSSGYPDDRLGAEPESVMSSEKSKETATMFSSTRSYKKDKYSSRKIKSSKKYLAKGEAMEKPTYRDEPVEIEGEESNEIKSGLLTAGELNDFSKWKLWQDISGNQLKVFKGLWKMTPQERYCVQLTTTDGKPAINAQVFLKNKKKELLWAAMSDNTGKAELWLNIFDTIQSNKNLYIEIEYQGRTEKIKNPTTFHKGINIKKLKSKCDIPDEVDIVFVVDATGSMGDEISYLKAELEDVIGKVKSQYSEIKVNTGSVFYRDVTDAYLTQKSDLTSDTKSTINFIKKQHAAGGGDFPEAVEAGLDVAINELSWSEKARAKVIFLILDAPPHNNKEVIEKLQNLTKIAAREGIRIVPVTASGINKSTEYLMRSIALATNGTYVFLTDDSGIGGSHIKPTTDEYKVETLNDIFIRLIDQYLKTPDCDNKLDIDEDEIDEVSYIVDNSVADSLNIIDNSGKDTTKTDIPINKGRIKYYPNPTSDILNIEISGNITEMFLADMSGKILVRFDTKSKKEHQISIGNFPSGMYFIQYQNGERWRTGKVILQH